MKRLDITSFFTTIAAIAAAAVVLLPGCEDTPSTEDAAQYAQANPYSSLPRDTPGNPRLVVSPATANATLVGERLLFALEGGVLPIRWDVSKRASGTIEPQGDGRQAIYVVRTLEANDIIITDSSGQAALAKINGESTALSIVPSGDAELTFDSERIILAAIGGEPRYEWRAVYPDRGTISFRSSDTATIDYRRDTVGDNVIIVTDSNGDTASLVVSQPDATTSTNTTAALAVTADPSSLDEDEDLSLITATGGTPPYTFTVVNSFKGGIVGTDGNTVIYERYDAGDNAIQVVDDNGETAFVIISQP